MIEPLRKNRLGVPDTPVESQSRWAMALHLQKEIDFAGDQDPHDMRVSSLRNLEFAFDNCFPCHETMLAFWCEVRQQELQYIVTWNSVYSLADDMCDGEGLSIPRPDRPAILNHLHDRAIQRWNGREGVAYVIQEVSMKGRPEGSSAHSWVSIPMWSKTMQHVEQSIVGGWINGTTRFATSVGLQADAPEFIYGLDDDGRTIKADLDSVTVKAHLPNTWAQLFSEHGPGRAPIPASRLAENLNKLTNADERAREVVQAVARESQGS